MTTLIMPFGKYKGQPVSEIPESYIRWLKNNVELHGELARYVEDQCHAGDDARMDDSWGMNEWR